MIRVLIADDHTIVRRGLKLLLDNQSGFEVVGEASDGRETVELSSRLRPDVIVMDVAMPNLNGIEATRQITSQHPAAGVAILSMHSDESYVLRALRAGAKAYLLKDSAEADLISAIHAIHAGRSYFSPAISRMLQEDFVQAMANQGIEDSYELLTAREREILQMIAEGNTNKDIANRLGLSLYTVETHRTHILQKLNLHSVPELILYAVRKGIIA